MLTGYVCINILQFYPILSLKNHFFFLFKTVLIMKVLLLKIFKQFTGLCNVKLDQKAELGYERSLVSNVIAVHTGHNVMDLFLKEYSQF